MNWKNFLEDDHLKFPKDSHSIFPASGYHWLNYSLDKMIAVYRRQTEQIMGSKLHALAAMLIEQKQPLRDVDKTLNMYVNDCILYDMTPEKQLYFSEEFRGTADAIGIDNNNVLRIFDFKSGKTKASMRQLYIYVALLCLDARCSPSDFSDIETRIYQNNEIISDHPTTEIIVPIMDKMISFDMWISADKSTKINRK